MIIISEFSELHVFHHGFLGRQLMMEVSWQKYDQKLMMGVIESENYLNIWIYSNIDTIFNTSVYIFFITKIFWLSFLRMSQASQNHTDCHDQRNWKTEILQQSQFNLSLKLVSWVLIMRTGLAILNDNALDQLAQRALPFLPFLIKKLRQHVQRTWVCSDTCCCVCLCYLQICGLSIVVVVLYDPGQKSVSSQWFGGTMVALWHCVAWAEWKLKKLPPCRLVHNLKSNLWACLRCICIKNLLSGKFSFFTV